jgi:ketosteroid isomerase-like protein
MPLSVQRRGVVFRSSAFVLLGSIASTLLPVTAHAVPVPFVHRDAAQMHKEIEGLEQDWRQALLSSNIPELDHLLADDYLGVTANGTLETKADLLAMRKSGTIRFSQLDLSDLKVRVYGDTAVVTSRAEVSGSNGGTDISGRYRYTRVYTRRNGQWRIVSFEASRIADGRKH